MSATFTDHAKARKSADEGPVRSDFERLFAHAEFHGHVVPVSAEGLAHLLNAVEDAIGTTPCPGATMTAIGRYTNVAGKQPIFIDLADPTRLFGLVCDAMPKAGMSPSLHLFDGTGRAVHRVHVSNYADAEKILAFSSTARFATAAPFGSLVADLKAREHKTRLSHQTLFDVLDFVHNLRLPLSFWVGASHCRQRHSGAIDRVRFGPGCLRLWSDRTSLSCDLTFAATVDVLWEDPGNLAIHLRDENGRSFAGFARDSGPSERNHQFWNSLLSGLN